MFLIFYYRFYAWPVHSLIKMLSLKAFQGRGLSVALALVREGGVLVPVQCASQARHTGFYIFFFIRNLFDILFAISVLENYVFR